MRMLQNKRNIRYWHTSGTLAAARNRISVILIFIISCHTKTYCQNLVYNNSFEIVDSCPTNYGQLNLAQGWCGVSSELFSSCSSISSGLNIPFVYLFQSSNCYRPARTGNNIVGAGITIYDSSYYYREPIFTHIPKLISNKQYCISFYTMPFNDINNTGGFIDKIGAYLSPQPIMADCNTMDTVYAIAAIENTQGQLISDTLNWTKIFGIYTSNGTEEYLTLGCYLPVNSISMSVSLDTIALQAYYFYDDISIIELQDVDAGYESYICANVQDSAQLGVSPIEEITYSWQPSTGLSNPNIANPKASPLQTTTYVLTQTQCSSIKYDTVTVNVLQNPCTVGLYTEKEILKLQLIPNPSNGIFKVSNFTNVFSLKLKIFGADGTIVYNEIVNPNEDIKLNVSSGIYFYQFYINNEWSKTQKLVVVK